MRIHRFLLCLLLAGCAHEDKRHTMIISIPEQRLLLLDKGRPVASYPVSTSKFTIGDRPGSMGTPLGKMKVAEKIGDGAPSGAVFKHRRPTGEVLPPNAPGRDPIVTRILWLKGLERQNANAYGRYIYIHGTPEEHRIGEPASYGCIRMRSADVLALYNTVGKGARIEIRIDPLPATPLSPRSPESELPGETRKDASGIAQSPGAREVPPEDPRQAPPL